MGRTSRYRPRRRKSAVRTAAFVTALLILAALFLDGQMRPVIENMVAYQAKVFAARTLETAMARELAGSDVRYDDIVLLSRNSDGEVSSIQTNVVEVNRLKSSLTTAVVEELEGWGEQTVQVPLGTLMGNQLLSGRGPVVEIRVIPAGYVQTDLYNQFTSAGINQTLHQIMLKTNVQMVAVLPGYTVQTEISTSFAIAETVIVGNIPDGYTVINGDDSSTIAKINDYRADAGD